jgi:hypothetical protein
MPFSAFADAQLTVTPWRLVVIGLLVLILRRLPIMIALYRFIPDVKTLREACFSGHFGPIGVGAIFISTLAAKKLPPVGSDGPQDQVELLAASIQPIVAFMVICSITIRKQLYILSRVTHLVAAIRRLVHSLFLTRKTRPFRFSHMEQTSKSRTRMGNSRSSSHHRRRDRRQSRRRNGAWRRFHGKEHNCS